MRTLKHFKAFTTPRKLRRFGVRVQGSGNKKIWVFVCAKVVNALGCSQTLTDKRKCTSNDLGLHPFAGN